MSESRSGVVVAERVRLADSFRDRLIGLMGRERMAPDSGIWLRPCSGIHTFGMRFPLDVLILDRHERAIAVYRSLKSNRILLPRQAGFSVLEMDSGAANRIQTGVTLRFDLLESPD